MVFQPGSSVLALQSFVNPLLTSSISRLPHQPFRNSGSKLASFPYPNLFHPSSMPTSGPSPSHQSLPESWRKPLFATSSIQPSYPLLQIYLSLTNLLSVLPAHHVRPLSICSPSSLTWSPPIHQLQLFSLDFSKAFDKVRHSTLLEKMARLDLPVNVYNWLVNFFSGHTHCTVYQGKISTLKSITASIIQGSGIGPASYVINASDLYVLTPGNELCKFADDTYLIIPEMNVESRSAEIDHIESWAHKNNLTLNRKKSTEIVFVDTRRKRQVAANQPMPGIARVTSVKVLGVTVTNGLSASDHVRGVVTSCSQTLYALRVLRTHGMCDSALQTIFRSVVVAKLLYACSAWWGFINATDRQRVNAFLRRSIRCGYCPPDLPPFEELCQAADKQLFAKILKNSSHVLHGLLPPPIV